MNNYNWIDQLKAMLKVAFWRIIEKFIEAAIDEVERQIKRAEFRNESIENYRLARQKGGRLYNVEL